MKRLALLLGCCAVLCSAAGAGQRYALLVGVGQLPALPRSAWLDGPPRDLAAMRAALRLQGFAESHILSLGDSAADAAPATRAAVLAQLDRLARQLTAADVLLLYWSGHGMLLPGYPGQQASPLGHGVQLLTRDSRVSADGRQLDGGIASSEIGPAIDELASRQVQVVAVFDSCHAAGSTRGAADALAWRGLTPAEIGWRPAPAPERVTSARERPRFVGFFAAEAQQRSAESRDAAPGQAAGLFTRALVAALQSGPDSYQQWAGATLQRYRKALGAQQLAPARWPRRCGRPDRRPTNGRFGATPRAGISRSDCLTACNAATVSRWAAPAGASAPSTGARRGSILPAARRRRRAGRCGWRRRGRARRRHNRPRPGASPTCSACLRRLAPPCSTRTSN